MRWGSHARLKPLLNVAASRELLSEFGLSCGTFVASCHLSLFQLYLEKWTIPNVFKNCTLFISLFLFSSPGLIFSSCLAKEIWWQRTKHDTKRKEWRQWWEWSPRSEKREVSCWRVLSMTEGVSWWTRKQPRRMPRLIFFWQGLAAMVCFLWLNELCVTQTARGTSASELLCHQSLLCVSLTLSPFFSLFMFNHFLQHVAKKLAERLGNLRRRSWTWRIKWSVLKIKRRSCWKNINTVEKQLNDLEEETS